MRLSSFCLSLSFFFCAFAPQSRRCVTSLVDGFHCPAVFAASHNSKRIVGLRLGLLGFYRGDVLIAIEFFTECNLESLAMMVIVMAKAIRQHRRDCRTG